MINNKVRIVVFSFASLLAFGMVAGHVFAAYTITDNADELEVTIRTTMAQRTITFHVPNADDSTCSSYNTTVVNIDYGETLDDISVPNTNPFLGFSFSNWYQEDTFENVFSSSTPIENNIDLYAKYTRNNVLYDGALYYVSSNSEQIVDAQYVYKIAIQTWGVTPATSNENKIDLISASGVYKMTYSSDWTILRKIILHSDNVDWLASDGALMYAYGQDSDTSNWTDVYWAATPSINGVSLSGKNATGTVYIDYSKRYIGVVRDDDNIQLDNGSNRPYNSWKPADLLSGYQYSKYNVYFYLNNNGGDHGKDAPSWGS